MNKSIIARNAQNIKMEIAQNDLMKFGTMVILITAN